MPPPLPKKIWVRSGLQLIYAYWWIFPPPVTFWYSDRVLIFSQGALLLRPTIPFLHLKHKLKCRHGLFHDPFHPMELASFVALVLQEPIFFLSDVIEYHCAL